LEILKRGGILCRPIFSLKPTLSQESTNRFDEECTLVYPNVQHKFGGAHWMAKEKGGFRLDLGEPWESDLTDFCAANYKGSKTEVIREAIDEHIRRRLQEPEMRARFETARRNRLGS
jgi:hypothetical protein